MRIEEMRELTAPYEILELEPCKSVRLRVVRFELGKIRISPRWPGAPAEKEVVGCRVHIDPGTKPAFPFYFDLTPSRLVHQLAALAVAPTPAGMELEIHRDVPGPKAHYSVRWVPIT